MALGAFPSQYIRTLLEEGAVIGASQTNIQPSSLDLTLSEEAYRMPGIFLPRPGESIRDIIKTGGGEPWDLSKPLPLRGVFFVRLRESLKLPSTVIFAYANNKSSTGRINLQTRLICDGVSQFDKVPRGYTGELWLVISPRSFNIQVHPGAALNQLRFFNSDTRLNYTDHLALYEYFTLLYNPDHSPISRDEVHFDLHGGVTMSVNLDQDIIGYSATQNPNVTLDISRFDHDPQEFFRPLHRPENGRLMLLRDEFYILSTIEQIAVPPEFSVEMVAYDPSKGEFRSHYAGFFDPGFGFGEKGEVKGTTAVLEVYPHDNDFFLRHGQPICKMVYERLATFPELIYGTANLKSNYQSQSGPRLSKYFKSV